MSEQSLKWKFLFRNKFTDHLKEAVPRENYPDFIDYVRALKTEIDEVLLPRVATSVLPTITSQRKPHLSF